jgi:hypothetical protein
MYGDRYANRHGWTEGLGRPGAYVSSLTRLGSSAAGLLPSLSFLRKACKKGLEGNYPEKTATVHFLRFELEDAGRSEGWLQSLRRQRPQDNAGSNNLGEVSLPLSESAYAVPPRFSPRLSVILPIGDKDEGLGNDEVSYQINLALSREFERGTLHFNAGLTVIPDAEVVVEDPTVAVRGQTLNGYNLGASGIYFLEPNLHLMLEWVAAWDEDATPTGSEDHTFETLLSPGIRWAPYTKGDTQFAVGAGLPIGLSSDATDIALFLDISFEHRYKEVAE